MIDRNQIPSSWEVVKLGTLLETIDGDRGPNYPKKNEFFDEGYCLFLSTKNVREDRFLFEEKTFITKEKDEKLRSGRLQLKDVVITTRGTLGNVALYDEKIPFKHIRINSGMLILRITNEILSNYYLMKFITSPIFISQLKEKQSGTAQPQIPANILREIEIPLSPLSEQHRIVSKIEEFFSELDKGIESLKTAQQQLKVYRQAVLKWAFEGRLTNENVNDGELPAGWKWVKLGEVLDFVGSGVTPKGGQEVYQISGVIFIRSQNVYPNKLELDDVAFISDEIDERMKRTRVKANDVLLNITGASIGRCAYVPEKFPSGNVNQHVCILRTSQEKLFSKFLSSYLNSPTAQHEIMNTQAGATRQGLNFQQIRNLESPIPPISEQHQIVSEIETRLSVCDKLEETITHSLRQSEALRQSILKKAFEGKLVAQNPKDEPASILLERIKAEKAAEQRNVYRKNKPTTQNSSVGAK